MNTLNARQRRTGIMTLLVAAMLAAGAFVCLAYTASAQADEYRYREVAEEQPAGTPVGHDPLDVSAFLDRWAAQPLDAAETPAAPGPMYSLAPGRDSNHLFAINQGGYIYTRQPLDYETANNHTLAVAVREPHGRQTMIVQVNVTVADVAEKPVGEIPSHTVTSDECRLLFQWEAPELHPTARFVEYQAEWTDPVSGRTKQVSRSKPKLKLKDGEPGQRYGVKIWTVAAVDIPHMPYELVHGPWLKLYGSLPGDCAASRKPGAVEELAWGQVVTITGSDQWARKIEWTAPERTAPWSLTQTNAPEHYRLQWRSNGGPWKTKELPAGTVNKFKIKRLHLGDTVEARVAAVNAAGRGPWSKVSYDTGYLTGNGDVRPADSPMVDHLPHIQFPEPSYQYGIPANVPDGTHVGAPVAVAALPFGSSAPPHVSVTYKLVDLLEQTHKRHAENFSRGPQSDYPVRFALDPKTGQLSVATLGGLAGSDYSVGLEYTLRIEAETTDGMTAHQKVYVMLTEPE